MTNFASANVDDALITPGDVVIDADGFYPLVPGDYSPSAVSPASS